MNDLEARGYEVDCGYFNFICRKCKKTIETSRNPYFTDNLCLDCKSEMELKKILKKRDNDEESR